MKITTSQLKQIIKEELLKEDDEWINVLDPESELPLHSMGAPSSEDSLLAQLGYEMGGGELRGLEGRAKADALHEALLEIEAYRDAYDQAMRDVEEYEERGL